MTRKDYMNNKVTHREFYAAIAAAAHIRFDSDSPFIERCANALANGDEHLNTIPLPTWDVRSANVRSQIATALRSHGDFFSLAGGVCVMKEAARQAVERRQLTKEINQ